jgi:hypothetical protein
MPRMSMEKVSLTPDGVESEAHHVGLGELERVFPSYHTEETLTYGLQRSMLVTSTP